MGQGGREGVAFAWDLARPPAFSRVAFAWVPARPHLFPGGRAVCCLFWGSARVVSPGNVHMLRLQRDGSPSQADRLLS